jgi:TonB family protein
VWDLRQNRATGQPAIAQMNLSLEEYCPLESKRLGEEGLVLVSKRVFVTGCAAGAAIVGSSGSDMLDDPVIHFFENIDFVPAEIDGRPIYSTPTQPITFKLTN